MYTLHDAAHRLQPPSSGLDQLLEPVIAVAARHESAPRVPRSLKRTGALALTVLTPGHQRDAVHARHRKQHHERGRWAHQGQVHGVFTGALKKILGAIAGIQDPSPFGWQRLAFRQLLLGGLLA